MSISLIQDFTIGDSAKATRKKTQWEMELARGFKWQWFTSLCNGYRLLHALMQLFKKFFIHDVPTPLPMPCVPPHPPVIA
jgi:hypothetical protein